MSSELSAEAAAAMADSLWAATAVASQLPASFLEQAQVAFTVGINITAMAGGVSATGLAIMAALSLKHVQVIESP